MFYHDSDFYFLIFFSRNSATETVEQELLFVGQECGKLIALRDIIHKVQKYMIMLLFV